MKKEPSYGFSYYTIRVLFVLSVQIGAQQTSVGLLKLYFLTITYIYVILSLTKGGTK